MAIGDVRAVLQYIPQFSGKVFVVLFDEDLLPEAAVAETLLDLAALQSVGVKLVLGVLGGNVEEFYDWIIEVEVKASRTQIDLSSSSAVKDAKEILDRGQACVIDAAGLSVFDEKVVSFTKGLNAAKLIVLEDEDAITLKGEPIHAVRESECSALSQNGDLVGSEYLNGAAAVCRAGINRVHILNGKRQGVLVEELFSNEGVGTMVHTDSYREIRELREEDIPELLAMIGRSVRNTWLVPRSYEDIWKKRDAYRVMTVDDNVVGCVAIYTYAGSDMAELACLYVKQSHEGLGYGNDLVAAVLQLAKEEQKKTVFALTTRAAHYFKERLGWRELEMNDLPEERRLQLLESGRDSRTFATTL